VREVGAEVVGDDDADADAVGLGTGFLVGLALGVLAEAVAVTIGSGIGSVESTWPWPRALAMSGMLTTPLPSRSLTGVAAFPGDTIKANPAAATARIKIKPKCILVGLPRGLPIRLCRPELDVLDILASIRSKGVSVHSAQQRPARASDPRLDPV
jgi:hypothetical protein